MTSDSGSASAALYERARRVLPGGTTRVTTHSAPHPTYLESGNGAHVTDLDGVERLDFNGNFTTMIHGYAHPEIELAFLTMFGTFSETLFARYGEIRPLRPGFFEERLGLYNLYPLLVHVRLFGGSYAASVERTLKCFGC